MLNSLPVPFFSLDPGDVIDCIVTWARGNSTGLPQGGLIPYCTSFHKYLLLKNFCEFLYAISPYENILTTEFPNLQYVCIYMRV